MASVLNSCAPLPPVVRTPLHAFHRDRATRIIDFHSWHMPLAFGGIVAEHRAVRSCVGLFDVSHMGKLLVAAPPAALQPLLPSALPAAPGGCKYTHLLREDGTILDDVIFSHLRPHLYLCVCNAGSHDAVLKWFHDGLPGLEVADLTTRLVCLAFQGPASRERLDAILDEGVGDLRPFRGKEARLRTPVEGKGRGSLAEVLPGDGWSGDLYLTRTGYTGELGFEIFAENRVGVGIWNALLAAEDTPRTVPVGLGARDTLRLEKGYLLSGQDFDGRQTPLETGHEWLLDWDREFVGREPLLQLKRRGGFSRLFGVKMTGKAIPRRGAEVLQGSEAVGRLTSASFSPSLERGIGLGYLAPEAAKPDQPVQVAVRGDAQEAVTAKLPFV